MAKPISDLIAITAQNITDPSTIRFGVDNTDNVTSRQLSLAEIQKLQGAVAVDNVAALATFPAKDNQIVFTRGYTVEGKGANAYRYDAASSATVDGGFVINGPGSVGRYHALVTDVADVSRFGAVGDGVTDDTAAIQATIDAVKSSGINNARIFVPSGTFIISNTLQFGTLRGFTLTGSGRDSIQTVPSPTYPTGATRFVWAGSTSNSTMIRCDGAFFTVQGIGFYGAAVDKVAVGPTADRCTFGFNLGFTSGLGSGNCTFVECSWTDFDTCFQAGNSLTDGNCGDVQFTHVQWRYADNGLVVKNRQGVNYSFSYLQANDLDDVFHFDAGGGLNAEFVHTVNINQLIHWTSNSGDIGVDGSTFRIGYLKMDARQDNTPALLASDDRTMGGSPNVIFEAARIPSAVYKADGRFLFSVPGGTQLEVSHTSFMHTEQPLVELYSTNAIRKPSAVFRACTIDYSTGYQPPNWSNDTDFVVVKDSAGVSQGSLSALANWKFEETRSFVNNEVLPTIGSPAFIAATTARFYSQSLDFDLTSVASETLVVSAPGAPVGAFVQLSSPSGSSPDSIMYSAKITTADQIRVTAMRTDAAVGVNPGAGTFQFAVTDPP